MLIRSASFFSPCPAKITYAKTPLGTDSSAIDGAIAIKDIYPKLLFHMKEARKHPFSFHCRAAGCGLGQGCRRILCPDTDRFLAADGIENIIKVLEELEDEKLRDLEFIELDACPGGCVGGTLQVENAYVAKSKFKRLNHFLPPVRTSTDPPGIQQALPWDDEVQYEPVFRLGHNVRESIAMVNQMNELLEQLPGLDCGSCGAPTCRARAEDIVRGQSSTWTASMCSNAV